MSNVYRKFRGQMAAGGDTQDLAEESGGKNGALSLALLVVFFVWLGMNNPWMLVFVIGLIISIFLHEFGHYWTARKTGMKVTQFYMGFGPRLWSRKRGELEYGVRAIPLGAFVRIIGMSNLDDCDPADEDRSYRSKSYPRRLLVITAGSLMHMVIALTLLSVCMRLLAAWVKPEVCVLCMRQSVVRLLQKLVFVKATSFQQSMGKC